MAGNDNLKTLVSNANSGKQANAVGIVESDPVLAAVISKLIEPVDKEYRNLGSKNQYQYLNNANVAKISNYTINRIKDNENILQLFPDIELAIQILTSSILSPKDMVKTELLYNNNNIESLFPSSVLTALTSVIKEEINLNYNLDTELTTILRESLFITGSYVKAVIPESSVDEIINSNSSVSTESISNNIKEIFRDNSFKTINNLGILGNPNETTGSKISLEFLIDGINENTDDGVVKVGDKNVKLGLEVYDNYLSLKLPKLIDKISSLKIKSINKSHSHKSKIATENNKISGTELANLLYKNNQTNMDEFITVKTQDNSKRKSVGRPLVMKLPSESVIPVHIPGDETKHIGYFVLIDVDGNPLTVNSNMNYVNGLNTLDLNKTNTSGNSDLSSFLIQKAKSNLIGNDKNITIDHISRIYANFVEQDLVNRLKNGVYGKQFTISNNQEIYRIMLGRAFANKLTRMIYIPSELCTYFAFKYFDNGVGKSYLDDLKVLTSLRAILMFSKIMAMVKSAINITRVNISLDPDDPDPLNTIELAQHEIAKLKQQFFPVGINSPADLVNWLQGAGLEFTYEGHPGIPQTKFDFETKNLQHQQPDSELDELLRKQTYMAFGLSPETVDNGFNQEFAITVASNNILLSKRIIQTQNEFCPKLTTHIKQICNNDNVIINKLRDVLKDNLAAVMKFNNNDMTGDKEDADAIKKQDMDDDKIIDALIEKFIEGIHVELPSPDETSLETQSEAFQKYIDQLDKVLDSIISSDVLNNELVGNITNYADSLKSAWKHYFIRDWMSKNNFLPELAEIAIADEDGKPKIDIYDNNKSHIEGLIRSSIKYIKSLQTIKNASNVDIDNLNKEPEEEPLPEDSLSDEPGLDNNDASNLNPDENSSDIQI